jgi:hypothetical protein
MWLAPLKPTPGWPEQGREAVFAILAKLPPSGCPVPLSTLISPCPEAPHSLLIAPWVFPVSNPRGVHQVTGVYTDPGLQVRPENGRFFSVDEETGPEG